MYKNNKDFKKSRAEADFDLRRKRGEGTRQLQKEVTDTDGGGRADIDRVGEVDRAG